MTAQLDIFIQPPGKKLSEFGVEASRVSTVYHNTTNLKGQELNAAQTRASTEAEIVLKVFQNDPHGKFTPWDIYERVGHRIIKGNIGRAITTLTTAGYLEKTNEKKQSGLYRRTNYCWKLRLTNQTDKTL